jgi:catechol 2,3-dioxygenase-like lactoylglutathione lyase family enzyme
MNPSIEGVSLMVSDLEKSKVFYGSIPGAILEGQRPGEFARYRIGGGIVHLVQAHGHGSFHIELNADDLAALHQKLTAVGLSPSKPQHHPWGKTDFRLLDPDGNKLEFGRIDV